MATLAMAMNALRRILAPESQRYRRRGYQVFREVFPSGQIGVIADMTRQLVPPYAGKLRRQDGNLATNEFFPGTQLVKNSLLHPHLPLPDDLEPLSSALRALVTSPALAERLRLLDGVNHYIIHQTLLFFVAQTTDLHLDSWSVDTAPRGHTHTVWIPLQDLDHRSGVPSVIPWPRGKVVTEAELGLPEVGGRDDRYVRYHQALRDRLQAKSPEAVVPLLRMGDFIVWSSLTPHFTLPAQSFPAERLSLQVLIRPADKRWGDFLGQPYDRTSVELQRVTDRFSVRIVT
jgi:hypothetical protein